MGTVDKHVADLIISQNGIYADDPPVEQVIQYKNRWGGESYAILYVQDVQHERYRESDYVREPKIIWQRNVT